MLRIAFAVFQKSTLAPYPASNPGKYPFYPVTLSGEVKFYLTSFTGLKVANASYGAALQLSIYESKTHSLCRTFATYTHPHVFWPLNEITLEHSSQLLLESKHSNFPGSKFKSAGCKYRPGKKSNKMNSNADVPLDVSTRRPAFGQGSPTVNHIRWLHYGRNRHLWHRIIQSPTIIKVTQAEGNKKRRCHFGALVSNSLTYSRFISISSRHLWSISVGKKKIEKCFLCPSVIPFLSARIAPIGVFPPVASDVRFLRAIFYFLFKEKYLKKIWTWVKSVVWDKLVP